VVYQVKFMNQITNYMYLQKGSIGGICNGRNFLKNEGVVVGVW